MVLVRVVRVDRVVHVVHAVCVVCVCVLCSMQCVACDTWGMRGVWGEYEQCIACGVVMCMCCVRTSVRLQVTVRDLPVVRVAEGSPNLRPIHMRISWLSRNMLAYSEHRFACCVVVLAYSCHLHFVHNIWSPSDARGMALEIYYD